MVPEVLEGMLWLARLSLRSRAGTVRAGHGYADAGFRPSSLPFVSLVGPLTVEVEPERELPVASDVIIQLPGFLRGGPRAGEVVPAGASLEIVLDGDAFADISLDGGAFATPAAAAAVCADVEAKLRDAATGGAVHDEDGGIITDPDRLAELGAVVCRWDAAASTVVLSSGRRGYVARLAPSMVEVRGGTAAALLGFAAPVRGEPGRHARHRSPAPKAFGVDVRLDLWAPSQRDLGHLVDALVQAVPTRTRVVTRPALLAEDLAPGDVEVRLLEAGEPTTPESLLHLEATDGFRDRVTDTALTVASTASAEVDPPRLRFAGSGVATRVLATTPVVPDPRRADALLPRGAALTLGLRFVGAADGHGGRIAALHSGGQAVLELDYQIHDVEPGAGVELVVDLIARARFRPPGGAVGVAAVTRRVPLDLLDAGAPVHLVAQTGPGTVSIAIDGTAQDLSDPDQTPAVATNAPGALAIADDLTLQLGNPAGNPAPFELDHVHLFSAPVPALDPRLRSSVSAAAHFRPGEHLALGASERGLLPVGPTEAFYVRAVAGDVITLDRPVAQRWRRGRTLVHGRDCFVQQREVKRRDDLMNRLYRYCIGYRVSAFLEQPDTAIIGGLVIEPVVDVEPRGSARSAPGAPGVRTVVLSEPIAHRPPQPSQE